MPDYPREQLLQLYKDLPNDLQEAIYSEENALNIREICIKNGISDESTILDITRNIGYVFLGLLLPNEFSYILEKEVNLEKNKAELVASEINRFIFMPVRTSLEALYKIEIKPTIKPDATLSQKISKSKGEAKKDSYRESTE